MNRIYIFGCFSLLWSFAGRTSNNIEKNALFYAFNNHEFHISRTDINFDINSKSLQISIHVFIDDIEKALQAAGHAKIGIGSKSENENTDTWLSDYLASKLVITNKNMALKPYYIGKELSEDLQAIYCYFEISLREPISDLTISNNILHEIYSDQTNLVSISKNRKRISLFKFDEVKDIESVKL